MKIEDSIKEAPISAVIFDMDGLMLDTERIAIVALKETARQLLHVDLSTALIHEMIGLNEKDSNQFMRNQLQLDIPEVAFSSLFYQLYDELLSKGTPKKAGLDDLLSFLSSCSVPMMVATSTILALAKRKLEGAGILHFFQGVVGGDMVARGKPEPDIYLRASEFCGTPPSQCLALEDSENGVRSAVAAGMRVICVPDIKAPSEEVKNLLISLFHRSTRY